METLNSIWPLFTDIIKSGGLIMYPIITISVLVWMLGLQKFYSLIKIEHSFKMFCKYQNNTGWTPFNRFSEIAKHRNFSNKEFSSVFDEMMIETIPALESGFSSMSSLIAAAPLLGLLGTVIGMIKTFAVIMQFGIGNPHMMAEGISIALLTTQAGLTAAFPGMLFHNWLIERKENLIANINNKTSRLYPSQLERGN